MIIKGAEKHPRSSQPITFLYTLKKQPQNRKENMYQMTRLAEILVSEWQNYYHLVLMVVIVACLVFAFYFLKKNKKEHEEEMETPAEIHPRGETLPFHVPLLETNVGGIVEEAVTPEVATAEKKSLSPRRIKKKMLRVTKKKTQQSHNKKDSTQKKVPSKTKEVIAEVEKKVIVPTVVAPLPTPPPTPAVAIVSKKKPIKKKAKKVHIPHKPMIGEVIQMPAETQVKTEQAPHAQIATI